MAATHDAPTRGEVDALRAARRAYWRARSGTAECAARGRAYLDAYEAFAARYGAEAARRAVEGDA